MEKFVNHEIDVKPDDEFAISDFDATTEDMPSEVFADFKQPSEQPEYTEDDLDASEFDGYDPTDTY